MSDAYAEWKGWVELEPFGSMSAFDSAYFAKELGANRCSLEPGMSVLEVGCGNGSFLAYAQSRGCTVVGTELSSFMIEAGVKAGYEVLPADRLGQLAPGRFDRIMLFDVIEHIPAESVQVFLDQLRALLKDDGRILMRFPNADSWIGNFVQHGDPTHVNAIGMHKLGFYAAIAGLRVERFAGAARVGFGLSIGRGLYLVARYPLAKLIETVVRLLYFPRERLVLDSVNCVACLTVGRAGSIAQSAD